MSCITYVLTQIGESTALGVLTWILLIKVWLTGQSVPPSELTLGFGDVTRVKNGTSYARSC